MSLTTKNLTRFFCFSSTSSPKFVICYFLSNSHPNGCEACLTFVLMCTLMETCDVRHLFKYLLAISISLEKYLFHPFIHFYVGYLFLLNQVTTLCVLDNILSYIWLGNNILHPVNCLFAMLIIPFSVQKTFFCFSQSYLLISTTAAFFLSHVKKYWPRIFYFFGDSKVKGTDIPSLLT